MRHEAAKAVDLVEDRIITVLLRRQLDLAFMEQISQAATEKTFDYQVEEIYQDEVKSATQEVEDHVSKKAVFLASCYTAGHVVKTQSI